MMRFLVDECTGPSVAHWLSQEGHDVFSVYDDAPGIKDDEVIRRAVAERRILITNEKDFGERVFRERQAHQGVVFLRLSDERSVNKISVLRCLIANYGDRIAGQFVVVTETQVRFSGG